MRNIKKPYPSLNIADYSHIFEVSVRFKCDSCKKNRKFFCYSCSIPHPEITVPNVKLPFKIDIVKHRQEADGKSTSCHAKMLAGSQVNIYEYPNIPDYEKEKEDCVLLFVSPNAVDIKSLFKGCRKLELKENYGLEKGYRIGTLLTKNLKEIVDEEKQQEVVSNSNKSEDVYTLDNLPFKKAVFIDSTWKQCRGIYQDQRIQALSTVIIQNRITKFWRKQKGAPNWFLSTIEAIHQFLVEFHINAWGISKTYYDNCLKDFQLLNTDWIPEDKIISLDTEQNELITPYNGQYDNLLFFFSFVHSLIHSLDNPNQPLPKNNNE
jgi:hypothetical protein